MSETEGPFSNNPYASPSMPEPVRSDFNPFHDRLAGRFTRFAAAFVDGLVVGIMFFPVQWTTGYWTRLRQMETSAIENLAMTFTGWIVVFLINGYLLCSRGQSVGKLLTGIQIVDSESSKLVSLVRVFFMRFLWIAPIVITVNLIPGFVDDQLITLVSFVDAILIFGVTRRCLHDYIAGTIVVEYRENRPRHGQD